MIRHRGAILPEDPVHQRIGSVRRGPGGIRRIPVIFCGDPGAAGGLGRRYPGQRPLVRGRRLFQRPSQGQPHVLFVAPPGFPEGFVYGGGDKGDDLGVAHCTVRSPGTGGLGGFDHRIPVVLRHEPGGSEAVPRPFCDVALP